MTVYSKTSVCLICSHYQWRIQDFPEVGAPTIQGVPTYNFAKYSQELHEIERIWIAKGRGVHPWRPLDPPLHYD